MRALAVAGVATIVLAACLSSSAPTVTGSTGCVSGTVTLHLHTLCGDASVAPYDADGMVITVNADGASGNLTMVNEGVTLSCTFSAGSSAGPCWVSCQGDPSVQNRVQAVQLRLTQNGSTSSSLNVSVTPSGATYCQYAAN